MGMMYPILSGMTYLILRGDGEPYPEGDGVPDPEGDDPSVVEQEDRLYHVPARHHTRLQVLVQKKITGKFARKVSRIVFYPLFINYVKKRIF